VDTAYSYWMLNWWCITWPAGFKRWIKTLLTWTLSVVWVRFMHNTSFRELTLLTCSGFIVPGGKKEQTSSWEAYRPSDSQEILHILRNPKIPYRIHKRPPPIAILSQINTVDAIHRIFWRSIILSYVPPTSRSSRRFLFMRYTYQNLCAPLLSPIVLHTPPISYFLFNP